MATLINSTGISSTNHGASSPKPKTKYDITAHPNYKYLSDSNPKNAFHIEKYLSRQLKLRLEEESMAYEIDVSEDEEIPDELTDEVQLLSGYNRLL